MPDKQKDVIIEQAALKATNECKPVHLTVWYVPHPLKLVTFSCGGLDAFFQSSKKKLRTRTSYILLAQGQCLFVLVIYLLDYLPGPFCKSACKVTCKARKSIYPG